MRYDDMLDMEQPKMKHPRMTLLQRAAQFSPFAALSGYGDELEETARTTQPRWESGEDEVREIDSALRFAARSSSQVRLTYFLPDARKDGGSYRTVYGRIRSLDAEGGTLTMEDGTRIALADVAQADCGVPGEM